jgi:hypothetical protein
MRGHFFFMIIVASIIIASHALLISVAVRRKWFNGRLPEMYKFPHIEIKLFIIFSMGMLNVSLGVLSTPHTAIGWKVYCTYTHTYAMHGWMDIH